MLSRFFVEGLNHSCICKTRSCCRECDHHRILENLIAFSDSGDYYGQRIAGSLSLGLSNSIPLTEAMIVISAVMKSLVFLYCFSIILAVHPAAASTTTPAAQEVQQDAWVYYATDEDGTAYAYSPGLMERLQGNIIKVWVKALYSEKNQKYNEGQFEWEINCSKKTMRGISANIIKKNGTSEAISKSSDWSPIPAESTAETLFELTCKKEKQDKKK